jgi:hypothetical protein
MADLVDHTFALNAEKALHGDSKRINVGYISDFQRDQGPEVHVSCHLGVLSETTVSIFCLVARKLKWQARDSTGRIRISPEWHSTAAFKFALAVALSLTLRSFFLR